MGKCDNCELRKWYAKKFDLHWLDEYDCPYECPFDSGDIEDRAIDNKGVLINGN